jgi:ferredoxin
MKVTVDPDRCQGHARCWEICPEVFSLDEVGHAVVASGQVPSALEAEVTKAAANCPERAITVGTAVTA